MRETAKIENILITACIPQNDTTITPYFIISFTELDTLGLNADYLIEQAQGLYEKYGLGIVENANEAINEAVGGAIKSAVEDFIQSLSDAVSGFFKNLFS